MPIGAAGGPRGSRRPENPSRGAGPGKARPAQAKTAQPAAKSAKSPRSQGEAPVPGGFPELPASPPRTESGSSWLSSLLAWFRPAAPASPAAVPPPAETNRPLTPIPESRVSTPKPPPASRPPSPPFADLPPAPRRASPSPIPDRHSPPPSLHDNVPERPSPGSGEPLPPAPAPKPRGRKRWNSSPPTLESTPPPAREKPVAAPVPKRAWSLSGTHPKTESKLTDSSRERYREFKELIAAGMHPKTAAETLGDMKYTKLRGAKDLFEVRLSGKDRVLLRLDEAAAEVTILQAGGHT